MELTEIKGLGAKRIESLKRAGFMRPEDLLFYFPKKYLDTANLSDPSKIRTGDEALFFGSFISKPIRKTVRKGLFFVKADFKAADSTIISCIWFNNKYITNSISEEKTYYLAGKAKRTGKRIEISSPNLYDGSFNGIVPIYPAIGGLSATLIRNIIASILDKVTIRGYLDNEQARRYSITPLASTVKTLHRPSSMLEVNLAKKSAALEIFSCELAAFFLHKDSASGKRVFTYENNDEKIKTLISTNLPYQLTASQTKALWEIIRTFGSGQKMNRLLLGDVGSGKTVVALIAMYYAFLSGYQSVLMAPTEILARQHFETVTKLFEVLGVKICLLTGSQTRLERMDKLFNIKNGLYDFIIGTHALIQDDVEFSNLSLIVTDEQQRFGVEQRGRLENKSLGTDCLTLTATPIPRTLALTLYGELELSTIERIETKRAQTRTRFVPHKKMEEMFDYVAKKAGDGEKTYIVCPRIEDEDDEGLFSVQEIHKRLEKKEELRPYLSLLHGQMKDVEKNRIMDDFHSGKTRVLVATTVVEVGIDVSDATSIIIFNPERFGLSQLHQLRGRVGRGEIDSYCFLLVDENTKDKDTLNVFLECNDGFELAEFDFKHRGAGDFIGTRQHGGSKLLSLVGSTEIVVTAKNIANELLSSPLVKEELKNSFSNEKISYIKNITLN